MNRNNTRAGGPKRAPLAKNARLIGEAARNCLPADCNPTPGRLGELGQTPNPESQWESLQHVPSKMA
eukprot:2645711-Lingulodinium_polyedra.AAC.1